MITTLASAIAHSYITENAAIQLDCTPTPMNWNLLIVNRDPILVSSTNTKTKVISGATIRDKFRKMEEEVTTYSSRDLRVIASILDAETFKAIYQKWRWRDKGESYWIKCDDNKYIQHDINHEEEYGTRIILRFEDVKGIYIDTDARQLRYVDDETRLWIMNAH